MMLLVRLDDPSPRARYIIRHMLEVIGGIPIQFVEGEAFSCATGPKLTYGGSSEAGAYHIPCDDWCRSTIQSVPAFDLRDGEPLMFPLENGADPFATAFYLLSLADEMHCTARDEHGRVRSDALYVVRELLSDHPYIDEWALRIANELEAKWPGLIERHKEFEHTVTVDMDNILRYAGRPFLRAVGASAKDVLRGSFGAVSERWAVLSGQQRDPFLKVLDTLRAQRDAVDHMVLFYLLRGEGKYDHAASLLHPNTVSAILSTTEFASIGLHPSYHSSEGGELLKSELFALRSKVGTVERSRQHFLRWALPDTLRSALENGIREEHSLGFRDRIGFRASTCTPFKWYDLERDCATDLTLVPFAAMDSALIDQQQCKPQEVLRRFRKVVDEVRKVNGNFVSVWHDRFLSGHREFAPWPDVFKQVVQYARS